MNTMYTKKFFQTFVTLWETSSADQMAQKLNINRKQVSQIAGRIRKLGYPLTYKRQNSNFELLLEEALSEIGYKKSTDKTTRTYKKRK